MIQKIMGGFNSIQRWFNMNVYCARVVHDPDEYMIDLVACVCVDKASEYRFSATLGLVFLKWLIGVSFFFWYVGGVSEESDAEER